MTSRFARQAGRPIQDVTPEAMDELVSYRWPGNVRDLQNVIERAVILARGPLVDLDGQVIGINTAIISHGSEGNQGIGFAIPVNLARTVMDQILKNGKVTRAYLGIVPQDLTPAIAKAGQPQ